MFGAGPTCSCTRTEIKLERLPTGEGIIVSKDEKQIPYRREGTTVLGSVSEPGKPITVTICGPDAEAAMEAVVKTIEALNADFAP